MTLPTTETRSTHLLTRRSWLAIRHRGNALTLAAVIALGVLVLVAILAPVIAPYDPNQVSLIDALQPPSAAHLLGTDEAGRDVLSRVIWGARISLLGPLGVVLGSTLIGVTVGVLSAWRGGWVDATASRFVEILFAFPGVLLAILIVAVFGPGLASTVAALAVAYIPYMARTTRSVALAERQTPYIRALELQGMSAWRITSLHLVPNIAPFVLAQASLCFGYAMIDLAGLSFLGFGVQPPEADWGAMVAAGQAALIQGSPAPALAPGAVIVIAVVSFSLLGEGIAERVRRTSA
ncbi:ABC transporter permease [Agromyces sp. NBRC 114283]|uniref:ABC transporter permease n=1 Tax=Agromyces sp. NBRC 114283 TaxID=2994521 RepID=UPI0024A55935|nr:ABC transporter permease [Agromyces sp. NBRC 114283]GLU88689.1 peptide ABC transporter substrate-binding protein [Agromyces sp. NBRC 114283]